MNITARIISEIKDYNGIAVIDRGQTLSYQQLFHDVKILAEALEDEGVSRYSRIALLANDSYEYIVVSLAILSLNAALVPVSSRATPKETEILLREIGVNILIAEGKYAHPEDRGLKLPDTFPGTFFLRPIHSEVLPIELENDDIAAFIRFSSGTTGTSKGVVLSHRTVIERTDACTELGVTRGEYVFWVLDMAFHFVVTILLFLRKGAVIVICGQPLEEKMSRAFRDYPLNLLYATPYHYKYMTASPEFNRDSLRFVRRAFSTAMKLEEADAALFREKFELPLTQAYGIIEVGLPCVNISDRPEKAESVGQLQPAYTVDLADADERGRGRIRLKGPGLFDAYLFPFKRCSELFPDGFFDTGDIGLLDDDGYLFIVGRAKNLINFAGMKIFPYEIESLLQEHELVRETRVSGRPLPGFGEIPVAEIVAAFPDELPRDWQARLRKFCFEHLSSYKVPKEFLLVDSLPKTASGKIKRN